VLNPRSGVALIDLGTVLSEDEALANEFRLGTATLASGETAAGAAGLMEGEAATAARFPQARELKLGNSPVRTGLSGGSRGWYGSALSNGHPKEGASP
jgi:hypothetical protein